MKHFKMPKPAVEAILASVVAVSAMTGMNRATAQPPALPLPTRSITSADLGVVIATGDPLSEAVGAYYAQARGIPPQNVVHVTLATGAVSIPLAQAQAIKAQIDAALPANVQATLLTWSQPSAVSVPNGAGCLLSITTAIAITPGASNLAPGTDPNSAYCGSLDNPYYDAGGEGLPWPALGVRPSMLLGASTLAEAQALIDRGVAADGRFPAGTGVPQAPGYLVRTTDSVRSIRASGYPALASFWAPDLDLIYDNNGSGSGSNYVSGQSDVLFYFTGLPQTLDLATNGYAPGAVGDSLTSFGGVPGGNGQTTVWDWLSAGLTGSYGTVEEPYAYAQKFSNASILIDRYYRGQTLIESYWQSVQLVGEGLFVGEPLARPFPDPLQTAISGDGSHYEVTTRGAFRPNARYVWDYQAGTASWSPLAAITTPNSAPAVSTYGIPTPPSGATNIRLLGPCSNTDPFNASLAEDTVQIYAGSRTGYELEFDYTGACANAAASVNYKPSTTVTDSTGKSYAGLSTIFTNLSQQNQPHAAGFWPSLGPAGGDAYAIQAMLSVPSSVAPGTYTETITLNNTYGETQQKTLHIQVLDPAVAAPPAMNVVYPQSGWWIPLQPSVGEYGDGTPPPANLYTQMPLQVSTVDSNVDSFRVTFTDESLGVVFVSPLIQRMQTTVLASIDLTQLGLATDGGFYGNLTIDALDVSGAVLYTQVLDNVEID